MCILMRYISNHCTHLCILMCICARFWIMINGCGGFMRILSIHVCRVLENFRQIQLFIINLNFTSLVLITLLFFCQNEEMAGLRIKVSICHLSENSCKIRSNTYLISDSSAVTTSTVFYKAVVNYEELVFLFSILD